MRSLFRDLNAREAAAGDPGALRLYGLRSGAGSLFWGDLRARGRPVPPKALQSAAPSDELGPQACKTLWMNIDEYPMINVYEQR